MHVDVKMEARSDPRPRADPWTWEELYATEGPGLLRYVTRLLGTADGPDVLQDAFERAIRATRVPPTQSELRPWLYRIVTNRATDVLRRRRRWRLIPWQHARLASDAPRDEDAIVRLALQALTPEHATVLVLRVQESLSRSEIARALGISEAAVKGRLARARVQFVATYRRMGGTL